MFAFILVMQFVGHAQMSLVWSDEFDYNGVPDPTKWGYDVGGGGYGNNELQYYTNANTKNANVSGGVLTITALKESFGGNNYTSARLVSKLKGDWLYGRMEVKAKFGGARGSWPAIWMLPTDWYYGSWPASGEIDIMEHVGYDPGIVHGTIHTKDYNGAMGTQKGAGLTVSNYSSAFHVYAVEWYENKIDFFVDNNKYYTYTKDAGFTSTKWPFDKRFHLILNLAVGGNWGGVKGVDDASFPWTMQVDYVRVYQDTKLKIQGTGYVKPNQKALEYKVDEITGASYHWTVPSDASITSGQGTSKIAVDWGASEGTVTADASVGNVKYSASLPVGFYSVPSADPYLVSDFSDASSTAVSVSSGEANTITISNDNAALKVNYNITKPLLMPNVTINLPQPIDVSKLQNLNLKMKTANTSGSVLLRVDLVDVNGNQTNVWPVFMLNPVLSDSQFHNYTWDFTDHWASSGTSQTSVDKSLIKKIVIYVNSGSAGIPNKSDEFWIDDVKFSSTVTGLENVASSLGVRMSPNPFVDRLRLESPSALASVRISDLAGRTVYESKLSGVLEVELPLYGLSSGIYLLHASTIDSKQTCQRIVKSAGR